MSDARAAAEALVSRPPMRWGSAALPAMFGAFQLLMAYRLALEDAVVALLPLGTGGLTLAWLGRRLQGRARAAVRLTPDAILFTDEDGRVHSHAWESLRAVVSNGTHYLAHFEGAPHARSWGRDWTHAEAVAASLQRGAFSAQSEAFVAPSDTRSALALALGTTLHRVDRLLAVLRDVAPDADPARLTDPRSPLYEAATQALTMGDEGWPALFSSAWERDAARRGRHPSAQGDLVVGSRRSPVRGVLLQLFPTDDAWEWILSCGDEGRCLARGVHPGRSLAELPSSLTTSAPESPEEAFAWAVDGNPQHLTLPEGSVIQVERVPAPDDAPPDEPLRSAVARLQWRGPWRVLSEGASEDTPGHFELVANVAVET